eukprot:4802484-Pyramimonas_sp.AAC.1
MYSDKVTEGYSKFKCSSCGCAKNPKAARYCKHCGAPLAAVRPVDGGAPQSGAWSLAPPGVFSSAAPWAKHLRPHPGPPGGPGQPAGAGHG